MHRRQAWRYREVQADFHGHVAELLAKATKQNALDQDVTKEDQEILLGRCAAGAALNGDEGGEGPRQLQPARAGGR